MKVKCALCDKVESIEDQSPKAKKLRNRRIHMYLCQKCNKRIADRTNERHATGKFKLYEEKSDKDSLI